jgi:hypothetical protein
MNDEAIECRTAAPEKAGRRDRVVVLDGQFKVTSLKLRCHFVGRLRKAGHDEQRLLHRFTAIVAPT